MNLLLKQICLLAACALPSAGSMVIFSEDFSSSVLPTTTQSTLGYYAPFANFGVISVAANEASIDNGTLKLSSTSDFRGIGIALDGASLNLGSYSLTFEILNFKLNPSSTQTNNDYFEVSVWTGSGYQQNSDDGVLLNAQTGDLTVYGNATVSEIANTTVLYSDATNTGTFNLDFNYTGSDAMVLYFGVVSDGWPFPEIEIDNISLVGNSVPEPSSAILFSLSSLILFRRKR